MLSLFVFHYAIFNSAVSLNKDQFRKNALSTSWFSGFKIKIKATELFKSKAGFEWKDKNKELVVNGVFHEVLSIEQEGEWATLIIVPDEKENKAFRKFFKLEKNDNNYAHALLLLLNLSYLQHSGTGCPELYSADAPAPLSSPDRPCSEFQSQLIKPPRLLHAS